MIERKASRATIEARARGPVQVSRATRDELGGRAGYHVLHVYSTSPGPSTAPKVDTPEALSLDFGLRGRPPFGEQVQPPILAVPSRPFLDTLASLVSCVWRQRIRPLHPLHKPQNRKTVPAASGCIRYRMRSGRTGRRAFWLVPGFLAVEPHSIEEQSTCTSRLPSDRERGRRCDLPSMTAQSLAA